jgi:ketosteroid isomerase-like protein
MTTTTEQTQQLLTDIYASFGSGDASTFEQHLSDDLVCIGTDEAEWFQGPDVLQILKTQLAEMSAAGISVTAGVPVIKEVGDCVIVADRPMINLPDGSSQPVRATLVVSSSGGSLSIEHMHLSVGAPNEEVVQVELTVPG